MQKHKAAVRKRERERERGGGEKRDDETENGSEDAPRNGAEGGGGEYGQQQLKRDEPEEEFVGNILKLGFLSLGL